MFWPTVLGFFLYFPAQCLPPFGMSCEELRNLCSGSQDPWMVQQYHHVDCSMQAAVRGRRHGGPIAWAGAGNSASDSAQCLRVWSVRRASLPRPVAPCAHSCVMPRMDSRGPGCQTLTFSGQEATRNTTCDSHPPAGRAVVGTDRGLRLWFSNGRVKASGFDRSAAPCVPKRYSGTWRQASRGIP